MISKVLSAEIIGMEVAKVEIESVLMSGLPQFIITGLADKAIREAGERVRSAIINSGFDFPIKKIIINLSPANLKKRGSRFDFPMAVSILEGTGCIKRSNPKSTCYAGELSLDGKINPVSGILPIATAMKKAGVKNIFVPWENRKEASIVEGIRVYPVKSLREYCDFAKGKVHIEPYKHFSIEESGKPKNPKKDFADVKGQEAAKRALMVAAAGNHALIMTGSPGTGKTMLAERIPDIMPELAFEDIIDITSIYSAAGEYGQIVDRRPFRKPGSGITRTGLCGGGIPICAGEITFAHMGVLFLDELGEFDVNVIDSLRKPIEEKKITIIRQGEKAVFPADFLLIGASNPCKCGYYMHPEIECTCSDSDVRRYQSRLSGPITDRIDMHIYLPPVKYKELKDTEGLSTADMKKIVDRTVKIQQERYKNRKFKFNGDLPDGEIEKYCIFEKKAKDIMDEAYGAFRLNPRTYKKTIKTARTIADMNECEKISPDHLLEALQYRERNRF